MKRTMAAACAALFVLAGCSSLATSGGSSGSGGADGTDVSSGLGSKDASGDVKLGAMKLDSIGFVEVAITVTNTSEKQSDYAIDVAVESKDGSQQLCVANAFIEGLNPGQSKKDKAQCFDQVSKADFKTAIAKLQTVQRTESL